MYVSFNVCVAIDFVDLTSGGGSLNCSSAYVGVCCSEVTLCGWHDVKIQLPANDQVSLSERERQRHRQTVSERDRDTQRGQLSSFFFSFLRKSPPTFGLDQWTTCGSSSNRVNTDVTVHDVTVRSFFQAYLGEPRFHLCLPKFKNSLLHVWHHVTLIVIRQVQFHL